MTRPTPQAVAVATGRARATFYEVAAQHGLPLPRTVNAAPRAVYAQVDRAEHLAPWAHVLNGKINVSDNEATPGEWSMDIDRTVVAGISIYVFWLGVVL